MSVKKRFSERLVAAPFGRYQSGDEVEPPANRVLIGREGQRAFFIDLLLHMVRRGAFLVTGRRGVGKTSFVRHCLDEYRNEVYKRFLHSNVGRVTFWDRAGVLILGLTALLVVLIVSELTEVLTLPVSRGPQAQQTNILLWLVVAPLTLVCLFPLVYASKIFEEVIETLWTGRTHRIDATSATIFMLGVAGLAWWFGPFGAPALSMSRLFLALCALYLWVQATSFNPKNGEPRRLFSGWNVATVLLTVVIGCGLILGSQSPFVPALETTQQEFEGNFLWALSLLGMGIFLRGWHLARRFSLPEHGSSLWRQAFQTPQVWYFCFGPSLILFSLVYLQQEKLYPTFTASIVLQVTALLAFEFLGGGGRSSGKTVSFRPRPLLILAFKALLCLIVALQLIHPVVSKCTWPRMAVRPENSPQIGAEELWSPISLRHISGIRLKPELTEATSRQDPSPANQIEGSAVFHGRYEELRWILSLFLVFLTIYFIEYEWIVRPFEPEREDSSINPSHLHPDWRDQQPESLTAGRRRNYNDLAQFTLPWLLYKAWLPILVVSINLGFEKLDHRRVVHAMLVGLRDQYHRAFLAWNSSLANLGRGLAFFVLMMLVTLAGDRWFSLPVFDTQQDEDWILSEAKTDYTKLCKGFEGRQKGPGVVNVICKVKWGDAIFHVLYYNLLQFPAVKQNENRGSHLLFYIFPYSEESWPPARLLRTRDQWLNAIDLVPRESDLGLDGSALWLKEPYPGLKQYDSQLRESDFGLNVPYPWLAKPDLWLDAPYLWLTAPGLPPLLNKGINLRIYHFILFFFFLIVGRWLLHRLTFIPYQNIVDRIDELMDNFAARTSVTSTTGHWEPAQWLQGLFVDERVRQTEQDPVDPRTVELIFLQILRDIQCSALQPIRGRKQFISLPTPEIIYVFDELDELGTRVDFEENKGSNSQQPEILRTEHRRSVEHKLLADMKNLLSSAPARFIFVGGRNLHDQWLADQTARQPFLTNIFNAAVYLPSLLTDYAGGENWRLHSQVESFLFHQIQRASNIFRRSLKKRWLPSLGLPLPLYQKETFVGSDENTTASPKDAGASLAHSLRIVDPITDESEFKGAIEFRRDFVQFLTYRSMGNPKRLKELLGTFVRPVGRVLKPDQYESLKMFHHCDHVLRFGDSERFRIQFLARIYRHLALPFRERLARRDDKLVVSIFHLTNYLFKFHHRGFSWSNLERGDELIHVQQMPDLREVLEAIVIHWSDRFLHRIRNGMYDFRFRSDFAREVAYISRQSHEEMASFNFTLDESQALKLVYEADIKRFKSDNTREIQELLAGLGELHELDQEFDTARFYYHQAIASLDTELKGFFGDSNQPETSSPALAIIAGKPAARDKTRLFMTWGISRLRLMLQVGMTFELARNLGRAEVEYRNARTLARSLLFAMLDKAGLDSAYGMELLDEQPGGLADQTDALKHLNLIFQPVFAEAWAAEKFAGGGDTSIGLVDKELWQIRNLLPFVREPQVSISTDLTKIKDSNFALIISELHNKAGDLYFFKGRQVANLRNKEELGELFDNRQYQAGPQRGLEGYLLRAHYHYAVGLHELRRFITHRRLSSQHNLNIWSQNTHKRLWETIEPGGWSDFIYRSAEGAFNDIAETILGRISLFGLFREIGALPREQECATFQGVSSGVDEFVLGCNAWLERASFLETEIAPAPEKPEAERIQYENKVLSNVDREHVREDGFDISIRHGGLALQCGTLGSWFGRWNIEARDPSKGNWRLLLFEEPSPPTDNVRLPLALNLMLAGARFLEKGGYVEDSAREHLKVCETVNYYLWWALAFRKIASWEGYLDDNAKELSRRISTGTEGDLANSPGQTNAAGDYWLYLLEVALFALKEADRLFRRSRRKEDAQPSAYLFGDKVPTSALTLACSLGLVAHHWNPQWNQIKGDLSKLVASWMGSTSTDLSSPLLRTYLEESLVRHSYPMINRLHGLKILIDDAVLSEGSWEVSEILDRTIELLDLSSNLNAPLHFTPLHSGTTCALAYLQYRLTNEDPTVVKRDQIRAAARRDLSDSEEMYTLRRAFYENIADLYYLYDDFNDRQIHFNHAIQMAGTEFSGLLRYLVDAHEPGPLPVTPPPKDRPSDGHAAGGT